VIFDINVRRHIPCLFLRSGPSAILGFVVASTIGVTIQCLSIRTLAHISKEIGKRMPAFADRDTDGAVGWVVRITRSSTPAHHIFPRLVRFAGNSSDSMAVHFSIFGSTGKRTIFRRTMQYFPICHEKHCAANRAILFYASHFSRHFHRPITNICNGF